MLILAGNGTAFLYSSADDDFVAARSVIPTPIAGYYGPIAAGPNGQYYLVNDQVLNQALTPIGSSGTGPVGGGGLPAPGGPSSSGRPVAAVAAVGGSSYARFSIPVTAANAAPADTGLVEVVDVNTLRTTATAGALEITSTVARAGARVNVARPQHGAGFGRHDGLCADGFRLERDSAGDRRPAEPAPGIGEWRREYRQLSGRGGARRLDLDFWLESGIGGYGGEFAPADGTRRRLRHAQ